MTAKLTQKKETEKRILRQMIRLYCNAKHNTSASDALCFCCQELADYAMERIERCPHTNDKTFCSVCRTKCYQADMRDRIRALMRFAGPRMMFHAPLAALRHSWIALKYVIRQRKK